MIETKIDKRLKEELMGIENVRDYGKFVDFIFNY